MSRLHDAVGQIVFARTYTLGLLATIDPAEREGLYRQAIREAMPDEPFIPIHHQVNVWALRKGLTMRPRMQEGIRAWEIKPD